MLENLDFILPVAVAIFSALMFKFSSSKITKTNAFPELLEEFSEHFGGYLDETNLTVTGFRIEGCRGLFYIDLNNGRNQVDTIRWLYQLETPELHGVTMKLVDNDVQWESPKQETMPLDAFVLWLFDDDEAKAAASGLANTPPRTIDELSIRGGKLTLALRMPTSPAPEFETTPGEHIKATYRRDMETLLELVEVASKTTNRLQGKRAAALLEK